MHLSLKMCLTMLLLQPMYARAAVDCVWTSRGGVASDVSVSPRGDVFVLGVNPVDAGFAIYRWKNERFETQTGFALKFSALSVNSGWATDAAYRIYYFDQNVWFQQDGYGGEIASGGTPPQVFVLGISQSADRTGLEIWRRDGNHWELFRGGAEAIAIDPDGNPWVARKDHSIARWDGNQWLVLPGEARHLGIGSDGTVWKIGTKPVNGGYSIERWNGDEWDRSSGGAVKIGVRPDGQPWVVSVLGTSYDGNCRVPTKVSLERWRVESSGLKR